MGRSECDIYRRGLRDGCRLEIEQDRIRRMKKEKEEEKETYKRRKNSKKEWDQDLKSKIKEELREEVRIGCHRLKEIIEEERKDIEIFMEEMREVREIKQKMEEEIREKGRMKFRSLCEEVEKEREIYLEELKEMKELMKYEIKSLIKLRQEKVDTDSEGEIAEVNKLNADLKKRRKELKTHIEEIKNGRVPILKIEEEASEEVTVKRKKIDRMIEAKRKDLDNHREDLKEIKEAVKTDIEEEEGFQKIMKRKRKKSNKIRDTRQKSVEDLEEL